MTASAWQTIFDEYLIHKHDFDSEPFFITAKEIKRATNNLEPRILCKQDTRESRPQVFQENNLFILPVKNGKYAILRGEGYIDIPPVDSKSEVYKSRLDFHLDTALSDGSTIEHLDYAFASSIIQTFIQDNALVMTIRDQTPMINFSFHVGQSEIEVENVKSSIGAGYEGRESVVLVHTKTVPSNNTSIRQYFYPYRQYGYFLTKPIRILLLLAESERYVIYELVFENARDFNSIQISKSKKYSIE